MKMQNIIWEPSNLCLPGYDFCISLDADFSRDLLEERVDENCQHKINELGREIMGSRGVIVGVEPYNFIKKTPFVHKIEISPGGFSLSLDNYSGEEVPFVPERPLIYSTSNVNSLFQQNILLSLFENWIDHTPISK